MDTTLHSVRKALQRNSSDTIITEIQILELIESNERKDKYREFRRNGNTMKEFIGFMPLENTIYPDITFVQSAQRVFAKGIRTPGRIYPFFGSKNSGVCISRKPDTVFTVVEDGNDYWILVCAVTYDSTLIQRAKLFSNSSNPRRSLEWDRKVCVEGGEPGWRRHFECIHNILYVEGDKPCDYPPNVLPIAVAKVQFSRMDSTPTPSLHIVERAPAPMVVGNVVVHVEQLSSRPGEIVFDKLFMLGSTIHSRHTIEEEEWPGRLYFDDYSIFPCVFNSWIIEGKLNMDELLNHGNVKMETKLFYDHSYKVCSLPHPPHVYLNYFEVAPPKEEKGNTMKRLVELTRKDMILFGCSPLIHHVGHVLYAAVPTGELANRLGLPTISGGRFHLIQALPVTRGTWKNVNHNIEIAELLKNSCHVRGEDDHSRENSSRELIELSSDSEEEGEENGSERRRESMLLPPLPDSRASSAEGTAGRHDEHIDDLRVREIEDTRPSLSPSPLSPLLSPDPLPPSFIYDDNAIGMDELEETVNVTHPESSMHSQSGENQLDDPSTDSDELEIDEDVNERNSCLDDSEDRNKEMGGRLKGLRLDLNQWEEDCDLDEREEEEEKEGEEEGQDEDGTNDELCTSDDNRSDEQPSPGDINGIADLPTERQSEGGEAPRRPSVGCRDEEEEEEEEEEGEITVVSLPIDRPVRQEVLTQSGFRVPKIHRKRSCRSVNALLEVVGSPIEKDTSEREELMVWNRARKESDVQSFSRLPPSAMVVVVDNELLRQMKTDELTPLIEILNENASTEENRIVLVIHEEFDPDDPKAHKQMRNINPVVVFVMKHSGETISNSQVECCERVKGIRGNDDATMVYLTPNTNADLHKNIKLVELGFKIYNTAELVSYWQSKQYEE